MKAAIVLPVLASHDAVGNDALAMVRLLCERGIDARLFCETAIGIRETTLPAEEALAFAGGPGDLLIYHFSVGWPLGIDILRRARGFRVVRYHNITPSAFFAGISPLHEAACARGREEIAKIAQLGCELYLGDSRYNLDELIEHGAPAAHGAVFAPFHRVEELISARADLALLDRLNDGAHNILMVGRIAPNKGHVELIEAFAAYVDGFGDPARLIIVGKSDPALHVHRARIDAAIARHRLGSRICWIESANEAQLKAAYLASHAFMILSRHEGFCVPLVEAMALGVPIVAHASSAIPETAGAGAVLWDATDPWLYAASLGRIGTDAEFRNTLRDTAQTRYAREFAPALLRERFFRALEPAL